MNSLELERESAVMLPEREALSHVHVNFALVSASSQATAVNVLTILSAATAVSGNVISISQ
jgi:hypothetical protein